MKNHCNFFPVRVPFVNFEAGSSMSLLLENLRKQPWYQGQLKYQFSVKETVASFAPQFPAQLNPVIVATLQRSLGIAQLYSHQATAIEQVSQGFNVVVATATSRYYVLPSP
jgi:ATP-dependent helicase YprA (DUF1998 family)